MNGNIASPPRRYITTTNNVIKPSKVIDICTYNVRTLHNNEHLDCLLNEVKDIKRNIIGLCETKLSTVFVEAVKNNHYLYNSDVKENESRRNGVGFLVKNDFNNDVSEFKPISDRFAVMKIRGKYNKLVIIQAYAPTSEYADEDSENFYCELQNFINRISNRDILLVNGDMNCKVGGLHIEEPNVVGEHNIEHGHNDRGRTFVDFCKQNNLSTATTQFKHRRKYTWISPGDRVRNTIDFICVRKPAIKFIKDAHVLSTPDISDHRLVRCKMNFFFLCNKKYRNNIKHKPIV